MATNDMQIIIYLPYAHLIVLCVSLYTTSNLQLLENFQTACCFVLVSKIHEFLIIFPCSSFNFIRVTCSDEFSYKIRKILCEVGGCDYVTVLSCVSCTVGILKAGSQYDAGRCVASRQF